MKCKNCDINEAIKYSKYSTGEFCSRKCSRSYSTKNKRFEINKKISKSIKNKWNEFSYRNKALKNNNFINNNPLKKDKKYVNATNKNNINREETIKKISNSVVKYYENNPDARKNLSNINTGKKLSKDTKLKLSVSAKKRCENIEERKRLRDIGRKGGFGKKGYTNMGIRYDSNFEKKCFEYLEINKIKFEPHKYIPDSSKVSDLYLPKINVWIELDGINREKRKKYLKQDYLYWKEKLKIYDERKLNYKIFLSFDDFKNYMVTVL